MMQSLRTRLSRKADIEPREEASGIPTPWPTSPGAQSSRRGLAGPGSRDIEKASLASESSYIGERRPLLAAAPAGQASRAPLEALEKPKTGLDLVRQPLNYKGPEDLATIRRTAAQNRDAAFARTTATLLTEAADQKPGKYRAELFHNGWPGSGSDKSLELRQLSNRLTVLESIYTSIQPNRCCFNKMQAEDFVAAVVAEFNLFCQTMPPTEPHCPKRLELLLDRVNTMISAVSVDSKTKKDIDETFRSAVLHQTWNFAASAREAGATRDLERYLALYMLWQGSAPPSKQAVDIEDSGTSRASSDDGDTTSKSR